MHPMYITSFFGLGNKPEPTLHENELRIYPVNVGIIDHHYELSDTGPSGTGGLKI